MAEIAVLSGSAVVLARSDASPARRAAGRPGSRKSRELPNRLTGWRETSTTVRSEEILIYRTGGGFRAASSARHPDRAALMRLSDLT